MRNYTKQDQDTELMNWICMMFVVISIVGYVVGGEVLKQVNIYNRKVRTDKCMQKLMNNISSMSKQTRRQEMAWSWETQRDVYWDRLQNCVHRME